MNNNSLQRLDAINRALIGFDSVFDALERRYANSAQTNYPPYNVARIDENHYDIEMAVTGFEKSEIEVSVERNELTIRGERRETDVQIPEYLHRGLALRNFERSFTLAEHMKVISAEIKNGVLTIRLEREIPEELKPRVIDIVEIK
jgi:molecular chaperone IbpA